jgi:hypothetical protein
LSLSFANALISRAAAPGSSCEKARISGPLSFVADALELSAGDGSTGQRVLHHAHVDAVGAGLGAELGELRDRQPPVLRSDYGMRGLRNRCHFGDQCLLVVNLSAMFSSWPEDRTSNTHP